MLYPDGLFEQLELDKIQEILSTSVRGVLGQDQVDEMTVETDLERLRPKLYSLHELKVWLESGKHLSLGIYNDIRPFLVRVRVQDYVLSAEECVDIFRVLGQFGEIDKTLLKPGSQWTYLSQVLEGFDPCSVLYRVFAKYIDEDGEIKDNATPELVRITKAIKSRQREIDRTFAEILTKYKKMGWLADAPESSRNSRRVLSVSSENKRKITGIIHDQSDTGKTTFIEPEEIVFLHNDIQELLHERRKEIYRILKEICNEIRLHVETLEESFEIFGRIDFLLAKARLALKLNAELPKMSAEPIFNWKNAVHPILWMKNNTLKKETVRFNYELHGENKIVLISGPNAGGKSICMKSVGLLQLMFQCGLLVPVDSSSEFGIFRSFFLDMGDQQSIEDDLSTYSSRLKHMKVALEESDKYSLILMDEFGSGSDPLLGGAIAEAWLNHILRKGCWAVLTTHYNNLKIFAHKKKGIINGSMLFDKEHILPTYRLKLGKPGSSYTFEIAQKVGLDKKVLHYARQRVGEKNVAVEDLLVSLQNEKLALEQNVESIESQKNKLQKLINQYEQLSLDMEIKKRKLKLDQKQMTLQSVDDQKRELEKIIRDIRKEKNLQKAEQKLKYIKEKDVIEKKKITVLQEEVFQQDVGKDFTFSKGDYVKIIGTDSAGEIIRINKDKAIVSAGILQLTVALHNLRPANEPLVQSRKSIRLDGVSQRSNFESKIDIRGYTLQEARDTITKYMDDAELANAHLLTILHGKGDGTLRRAVREVVKGYKSVKEIYHPGRDEGGDGITMVSF